MFDAALGLILVVAALIYAVLVPKLVAGSAELHDVGLSAKKLGALLTEAQNCRPRILSKWERGLGG